MSDKELKEQILKCFGDEQAEDGGYFALYDGKWLDVTNEVDQLMQLIKRYGVEQINGETSDGYHTFNELYDYRRVYNAALFNEWHQQGGKHGVHKSWKHSDGELCFGGGWFVVVAELPTGQVTNHYEAKYWEDFKVPEQATANTYDGHTPKEALDRIATLNKELE